MKWEKLATIKLQAGVTFGITSGYTRPRYQTVTIFLGPRRTLRCSCGQTYFHKPDELDVTGDTCMHIRALYRNGTVDDRDVHARNARITFSGPGLGIRRIGTVTLTPRGTELFAWRHVAQALE